MSYISDIGSTSRISSTPGLGRLLRSLSISATTGFTDVQKYYDLVGATNYNSQYNNEDYVYDATNVRMREISFGYTFRDLFGQSKNLTLSLIARNLFFFYKEAPMDPDVSMGTGNGVQGFDIFNLPTTRSFGLNVKLNF